MTFITKFIRVTKVFQIIRPLTVFPIQIHPFFHSAILIKTIVPNNYYLIEWDMSGVAIKKTTKLNENNNDWTISKCLDTKNNCLTVNDITTIVKLKTKNKSYNLITFNCQHVSKLILEELEY